MVEVELNWHELMQAGHVGMLRHIEAVTQGRPDLHGFDGDSGWHTHCEGACGELAVAKVFNRYYNGSVNTFREGGDVGAVQVRTRSKHDYELLVRDRDRDDDVFILVTGRAPRFRVVGWIKAGDAKRPEWSNTYGNRPAAYFVPHAALHPIDPK